MSAAHPPSLAGSGRAQPQRVPAAARVLFAMLARLARSDRSIPAGRVASQRAIVMADAAAAAELD